MHDGDLASAMRASLQRQECLRRWSAMDTCWSMAGSPKICPSTWRAAMGVDILIVVDVSTPLVARDKLTDAPAISNQMLAILIRRNEQRQLESLSKRRRAHRAHSWRLLAFRLQHRGARGRAQVNRRGLLRRASCSPWRSTRARFERDVQAAHRSARDAAASLNSCASSPARSATRTALHKLFDDQIGNAGGCKRAWQACH